MTAKLPSTSSGVKLQCSNRSTAIGNIFGDERTRRDRLQGVELFVDIRHLLIAERVQGDERPLPAAPVVA